MLGADRDEDGMTVLDLSEDGILTAARIRLKDDEDTVRMSDKLSARPAVRVPWLKRFVRTRRRGVGNVASTAGGAV